MSNGEWLEFLRMKVRNGRELGFEKLAGLGDMIAVNEGDLWQLHATAGLAHSEILRLRRSLDDLQEANNRYLERARAAEALVRRLTEVMTDRELQAAVALGDAGRTSIDLGSAIADLGKFVDMIEARAMAVDGPVTPFCEELHAASVAEKERFQAILSKLYQFRNCWQMVTPAPLVTPEWVQEKAALEDGHDPNWSPAWKTICEVFHALGYLRVDEYEHTAVISSIAGHPDSLDFVEMLIEVEKHSGFLIDENELPSFKECTIGDVVRLLAAKMAKAGAA